MKTANWTVLPLLLCIFVGCKSEEKKPAPPDPFVAIDSDLGTMQNELKDGIYQIDSVTKSLNRFAAATGDLRPPLSDMKTAIAELDSSTARIQSLRGELTTKQAAFQSSWSKEVQAVESASIRQTAERGRANVASAFEKLEQDSEAVGNMYREWEAKVKLVQSSLEADLSPGNQQTLASKIAEVNNLTPPLKESIRALSSKIEELSASIRTSAP